MTMNGTPATPVKPYITLAHHMTDSVQVLHYLGSIRSRARTKVGICYYCAVFVTR
jgi:hypothetical protein